MNVAQANIIDQKSAVWEKKINFNFSSVMIRTAKRVMSTFIVLTLFATYIPENLVAHAAEGVATETQSLSAKEKRKQAKQKLKELRRQAKEQPIVQEKFDAIKRKRPELAADINEFATLDAEQKHELKEELRNRRQAIKELNDSIKAEFEQLAQAELSAEEESAVETVEPDYVYETQSFFTPNDPDYQNQWGLQFIANGVDTDTAVTEKTVVAVIDTGTDFTNPDLQGSKWSADACVDADAEPISGGCLKGGYDFVDDDTDPAPDQGQFSWHGTAVAGVIAAASGNADAVASIGGGYVELMSLKASADGYFTASDIAEAIRFAVNNGADIINISFGGPTESEAVESALLYAKDNGILVISAAGNYGTDNDTDPIYPASHSIPNILSVAAHTSEGELASFSNYGMDTVDVAAPGVNIRTLSTDNSIYSRNGTSFSTPFVTAVAGYQWAQSEAVGYQTIKDFLLSDAASYTNPELFDTVKDNRTLKLAASFDDEGQPDDSGDEGGEGQGGDTDEDEEGIATPDTSPDVGIDTSGSGEISYPGLMKRFKKLHDNGSQASVAQDSENLAQQKTSLASNLDTFIGEQQALLSSLSLPEDKITAYLSRLKRQSEWLKSYEVSDAAVGPRQSAQTGFYDEKPKNDLQIPDQPSSFSVNDKSVSAEKLSSYDSAEPQPNGEGFQAFSIPTEEYPMIEDIQDDVGEIATTESIQELAEELEHDPLQIYNFLINNIEYEPYYGAKKGASGCLESLVCNDTDATSLSIALLRASDIPARYKKSLVLMQTQQMKDFLGVEDIKSAYAAFKRGDYPIYTISGNVFEDLATADLSQETHFAIEWVWPELFYEYDHSQSPGRNTLDLSEAADTAELRALLQAYPQKHWYGFDPVMRRYERTANEIVPETTSFDTLSFWLGFLQYQGAFSPLEKYAADLHGLSSKDIHDPQYQSTVSGVQVEADILPAGHPYQPVTGQDAQGNMILPETWSVLPDAKRYKVTIALKREQDGVIVVSKTLAASAIDNSAIEIAYRGETTTDEQVIDSYGGIHATPAELVDIVPVIQGSSFEEAGTAPLAIGDSLLLAISFERNGEILKTGEKFSIAGNSEGIYLSLSSIDYDPNLDDVSDTERDSKILLEGNAALAREYLRRVQVQREFLEGVLDVESFINFSYATVTQQRILSETGGVPTTFDFGGLSIDSAVDYSSYSRRGSYDDNVSDFFFLIGEEGSYWEGEVFDDITGMEGISTVRGLQYAYANPAEYTVETITAANESVIDTLNVSANTKANMHADVQAGRTVITPDTFVSNGSFYGLFYISYDDNNATYAIGEQTQGNGGQTIEVLQDGVVIGTYKIKIEGNYFVYSDKEDNNNIECRITASTYDNFATLYSGYDHTLHGLPCLVPEEPHDFGGFDHEIALATDGAWFKSSAGGYEYWVRKATVSAMMNNKPVSFDEAAGTYYYNSIFSQTVAYQPHGTNPNVWTINDGFLQKLREPNYRWQYYLHDGDADWREILEQGFSLFEKMGYPISNSATAASSEWGTTGDYQKFIGGDIYRRNNDSQFGKRYHYVPNGILHEYNSSDYGINGNVGTGGEFGFPESDPLVIGPITPESDILQLFEAGNIILHYDFSTDTELTAQAILFEIDTDKAAVFWDGFWDGFYEMGLWEAARNYAAGAVAGELIQPLVTKLIAKKLKQAPEKTAARVAVRYIPYAGWIIGGAIVAFEASQLKPLMDDCHGTSPVAGMIPEYHCGKLAAHGAAIAAGLSTDLALSNLFARAGNARHALFRQINSEEEWNTFVNTLKKNSNQKDWFFGNLNKHYVTDQDKRFILDSDVRLEKGFETPLGLSRIILVNDFVKAGKISQSDFEALEDMHQWIMKEFKREGKTFNTYETLRTNYWKKAAIYDGADELFNIGDIENMSSSGKSPNFPKENGEQMNLHHLEPKSLYPEHTANPEDLFPIPCSVHQWTHSTGGATYERFGSLTVNTQCGI